MLTSARANRWVIIAIGLFVASLAALPAQADRTRTLFFIARSKNANIVNYDVRVTSSGLLDKREPVVAYWIMRAEDGRREELSFFERQLAYGFSVSNPRDTTARLRLTACDRREIGILRDAAGHFRARIVIAGKPALLERIFVQSEEGALPRVRYVELFGADEASGKRVRERLKP